MRVPQQKDCVNNYVICKYEFRAPVQTQTDNFFFFVLFAVIDLIIDNNRHTTSRTPTT